MDTPIRWSPPCRNVPPLDAPWTLPLDCRRIPTEKKACEVAAEQIGALLGDASLPYGEALSVQVADSHYSRAAYLHASGAFPNHIVIARSASNRVYYRQPSEGAATKPLRGHPKWYGEAFRLADPDTWGTPSQQAQWQDRTKKGRSIRIELQRWNDLLMRGHRDCPMHAYPFDLIRCTVFDAKTGQALFKRPLWLIVLGQRRAELTLEQSHTAYRQRFDLEHFFRFGKNRLLLDRFQTPDVQHEERWWQLVCLAYVQLWLAAPLAEDLPRPWERYLPEHCAGTLPSPARVQRDFERIIRRIGTPARSPKRRGISPGRAQGIRVDRRPRPPIIFKRKKKRKTVTCSAS